MDDYKDEEREISLFRDDIVEILDISKPEKWLVRSKHKNLIQVCYIPPSLLEPVELTDKIQDLEYQRQFSRVKNPPKPQLGENKHTPTESQQTTISTISNDFNTIYTKLAKKNISKVAATSESKLKTNTNKENISTDNGDLTKLPLGTINENNPLKSSTTNGANIEYGSTLNTDKTGILFELRGLSDEILNGVYLIF